MPKKKRWTVTRTGERSEPAYTAKEIKNGAAVLENYLAVPQNVRTQKPEEPAIPLLGIYPREMETCVFTKAFT